jgi:beta-N-acetylhexosaminidase
MSEIHKACFALARLAAAVVLLWWALDWRSPFMASVRLMAFAGFVLIPAGLIALEVWALRRATLRPVTVRCVTVPRHMRALNVVSLGAAILCLSCVLLLEARFQWIRYVVLHADAAQLEKLGRHVVVGYRNHDALAALIERRAIAGVFLTARNVKDRDAAAVRRDVAAMQDERRRQRQPDLIVATDQEGGGVSRLSPPLVRLPPLSEIAGQHADSAGRRKAVEDYAATQARGLADLGINVNFAPVVDVDHGIANPDDRMTRIHARAISKDPRIIADVAGTYCAQLLVHGVRCTLKHFPGLGRVFEDTHLHTADLDASPDQLADTDWLPFRSLMCCSDSLVMLGHARLVALDRRYPVSFSRSVVGDLLRTDWRYDGVLITDDFSMGAVVWSPQGIAGASVAALNAGVDLILVSYDADQFFFVMHALIEADRAGRLESDKLARSRARLDRAFGQFKGGS